jgi:spore maturation protein CgeB
MNILLVGKFDNESFASHILQTLELDEHTVIRFQHGIEYRHKGFMHQKMNSLELVIERTLWNTRYIENKTLKRLDRALKNKSIDLTICTHDFLRPAEVDFIREKTKAPIVMWFPDAVVNFGRHMFLNAAYDVLFFKDLFITERLQKEFPSKKIVYLPECCNPLVHKKYDATPEEIGKYGCDITTAGNLYANRILFFEQLVPLGFNIKIWGNPAAKWMQTQKLKQAIQNEYIMDAAKGKAFSLAKIVTNNLHPGEIDGINCRAFEIPALYGFQLISYRSCINELFIPGKEIETYQDFNELVDKIRYYLKNDSQRNGIREAGYKRVHTDHTYAIRLKKLIGITFKK